MNAVNQRIYHILIAITVVMLGGGMVFYHLIEKWNYIDSFYFCVVTLATVGYGDFVPKTEAGRLFTSFYILAGIGVLAAFVNALVKVRGYKMRAKVAAKQEVKHKQ